MPFFGLRACAYAPLRRSGAGRRERPCVTPRVLRRVCYAGGMAAARPVRRRLPERAEVLPVDVNRSGRDSPPEPGADGGTALRPGFRLPSCPVTKRGG